MDVLGELNDTGVMNELSKRSMPKSLIVEAPQDLNEMLRLAQFLKSRKAPVALVGPNDEQIPLPREVFHILREVVSALQSGLSINVELIDKKVTTQQAADLLGISRNTLVRLLDDGELPYERLGEGRHRRLLLHEVLSYREQKRVKGNSHLSRIARQAQEDGRYEADKILYESALSEARKL